MECPKCRKPYGKENRIPLLLIKCGHSICQTCAATLFAEHSIACPECKTISNADSLENFPKNMALLSMSQEIAPKACNPQVKQEKQECESHKKKLEAFCNDDKCLLCINCILLDGHKSHNIGPIIEASSNERGKMQKSCDSAILIEEKLKLLLNDISNIRVQLANNANQKREKISGIYREITNIIQERESILKQQVANTLEKEEGALMNKIKIIEGQLQSISALKLEFSNSQKEGDCEILRNSKQRAGIIEGATQAPPSVSLNFCFPEIVKDKEIAALCKLLNPKGVSLGSGYTATSSAGYKKLEKPRKAGSKPPVMNKSVKEQKKQPLTPSASTRTKTKLEKHQLKQDTNSSSNQITKPNDKPTHFEEESKLISISESSKPEE